MGGVVEAIFGGGPKVSSGPSAAELEAQRKADEEAARLEEERLAQEAKEAQEAEDKARRERNERKRGRGSTLATGALGLESQADVSTKGLKTKLGA